MDFNEVKLFAKSLRLKYVNVWVSNQENTFAQNELDQIIFSYFAPVKYAKNLEISTF